MKQSLFKVFKDRVTNATANDTIWKAGFYFINLTSKQAEDLRLSTIDMYGDENGVVHYPNGINITPLYNRK